MKETSLDRFSLEKVKLVKDGGLDAHFELIDIEGALTYKDKEHKTSTKEPHPDLVTKINTLKPMLAEMWGYNAVKVLIDNEKFKGNNDQKDKGNREYSEQLQNIEVTGIAIHGGGDSLAIVITGKRRMHKNIFQAMNSGRVKINQKIYGFENDLEDLVEGIRKEVYDYLFENKHQNPTLFGDDEQTGKEKTEKKEEQPA